LVKLITDRPVFTSKVTPLLSGTVNYIFQQKSATPILSYFPNYSMESCPQSHYSRLGWCYGDLGISQAILSASGVMENKDWKDTAIKIFIHSGHRKDVRRNSVHDAGLCHGSIGVAHIFCRLYRKTGMEVFNEAAKYWYRKTLEYSIFGDTCAGYKHLIFPDKKRVWVNNFGLLAGITGIGLGIMSYLDHELTSWDECLLLS
jgi:lantibiotic modifying enzyme